MEPENNYSGPTTPVDEPASSTGDSRARGSRVVAKAARRPRPPARALVDTAGPKPSTALEKVRLTIGVVAGTHGVKGELKLKLLTDHPEHILSLKEVFLGESETPVRLVGARIHGGNALIQLEGVTTPEAGKLLGGIKVRIAGSDAKPLEEGEYFIFQLMGLKAVTSDGRQLGTVIDIIETGAHDVLVITPASGPDVLVPNHPEFVKEIAPEQERIVIDPPVYSS